MIAWAAHPYGAPPDRSNQDRRRLRCLTFTPIPVTSPLPGGEGDPDPQGLARGLRSCRGARRLAHRDRRKSRRLSRRDQQLLPCDGLGGRPALYPAPRRAEGFCQNSRQEHHRVCRLQRQPAVHQPRQFVGESEGAYFRDGLCASPAREDLGRGARGRGRSGSDEIADAAGLQGAARTGHPVQDVGVGYRIARSTSRKNSTRPMSRRRLPCATPASPNSKRSWPHCRASLSRQSSACSEIKFDRAF